MAKLRGKLKAKYRIEQKKDHARQALLFKAVIARPMHQSEVDSLMLSMKQTLGVL